MTLCYKIIEVCGSYLFILILLKVMYNKENNIIYKNTTDKIVKWMTKH